VLRCIMKPSYLCHISCAGTVFKHEKEGSSGGCLAVQVRLLPSLLTPLFTKTKHSYAALLVCRALVYERHILYASSNAVAHNSEWHTLPTVFMLILCSAPSLCTHLYGQYEAFIANRHHRKSCPLSCFRFFNPLI